MKQADLDRYASLMHEARLRLNVLRSLSSGESNTTYVRTNTESICLQLQKVLELIAFSSLVSHREAYSKVRQDIAKDWHGNRILKAVEKINPLFYPQPVNGWVSTKSGPARFKNLRGGYLSRSQFAKLYDRCGELLHSTNPFAKEHNFASFTRMSPEWVQRIEKLLLEHTVSIGPRSELLWVDVPMDIEKPVVVQHLVHVGT